MGKISNNPPLYHNQSKKANENELEESLNQTKNNNIKKNSKMFITDKFKASSQTELIFNSIKIHFPHKPYDVQK